MSGTAQGGRKLVAAGALLALCLAGCGGGGNANTNTGGNSTPQGSVQVNAVWPDRAAVRSIPFAAESVEAIVFQGGHEVARRTFLRPLVPPLTQSQTFTGVPAGSYTLNLAAYGSGGSAQPPVATGTLSGTVLANQTVTVTENLVSTVDHLSAAPNPLTLGAGSTQQLDVSGFNAANQGVMLWYAKLRYVPTNANVNVSATGVVTAVAQGPSGVTVTDTESGKSTTVNITVTPPPGFGGSRPFGVAVDSTSRFVYVADFGDADQHGTNHGDVRQYKIGTDGSLTPLSPASVTAGEQPVAVVAHPSQPNVYVLNGTAGTVSAFTIGVTGALTPLGSPVSIVAAGETTTGAQLAIDAAGEFVYAAAKTGTIAALRVNSDRSLSLLGTQTTGGVNPTGLLAFTRGGTRWVYLSHTFTSGQSFVAVYACSVNSDGTLAPAPGANLSSDEPSAGVVASVDGGKLFFLKAFVGGASNVYANHYDSGAGFYMYDSYLPLGHNAGALLINPAASKLYAVNRDDNTVAQVAVDAAGQLSALTPATVATPATPQAAALAPSGAFLYVTGLSTGEVAAYRVNADGTLTRL